MSKLYTLDEQYISELRKGEHLPFDFTGIVIHGNSHKTWYKNGELHREDGPAVEYLQNTKLPGRWYFKGKLHCYSGPAEINFFGTKFYCIHGVEYTEQEHKLLVDIMKLKGLL